MFGLLITLGLGACAAGSSLNTKVTSDINKKDAVKKQEPYYYDGNHKMRSTATGEICVIQSSVHHNGHTVLIGCRSNRVYYDYTLEKLENENAEMKAMGKKFIYKEFKNIHPLGKGGNSYSSTFWPWDPEKKMRYRLENNFNTYRNMDWEKYYKKVYLKNPGFREVDHVFDEIADVEIISYEEGKKWMYGTCKPRRF